MIAAPKPVRLKNPEFVLWVRSQPCILWGSVTPSCGGFYDPVKKRYASEACHVKSRGAGGDDVANVVPMCAHHHAEQHRGIQTFERKHRVDLKAIARRYWRTYQQEAK